MRGRRESKQARDIARGDFPEGSVGRIVVSDFRERHHKQGAAILSLNPSPVDPLNYTNAEPPEPFRKANRFILRVPAEGVRI